MTLEQKNEGWESAGIVGVDAGILYLGDPCYIFHTDETVKDLGKDWLNFCDILDKKGQDKTGFAQFKLNNGTDGLGVVVSTGYGDGGYEVLIRKNKHGRVAAVMVEFISEHE